MRHIGIVERVVEVVLESAYMHAYSKRWISFPRASATCLHIVLVGSLLLRVGSYVSI